MSPGCDCGTFDHLREMKGLSLRVRFFSQRPIEPASPGEIPSHSDYIKRNVMTKASKKTIILGFIGLGHMGLPIATNLLKVGYQLRVYNRTKQKAAPVIAAGAKWVDS